MSSENKQEISGVQVNEIVSQNPQTRIKSYIRLILLFLVLFGVLFIVGSIVGQGKEIIIGKRGISWRE